ncbi:hypothetical protein TYRP_017996 [Tyrophagus putrescentiae]|nr:hypothetical protein TYRP_017996 [Tyrophagus putrescentiae]
MSRRAGGEGGVLPLPPFRPIHPLWESASEAHGKVLAKSNSGGGGGGGSSSRDYGYHHHHHHHHNHYNNHQNTSLLDPSMLVDDEHIRELHRRRTAAGASNRLEPANSRTSTAAPPVVVAASPNSFEEDCFKDEKLMGMMAATEFNSNGNNGFSSSTDDLGSTIKQLTGTLASVTRATSRTVGDLWVKTQQELALQELREKTENHHALLCHEFTPYFSMKRKQMMNINGSNGGGNGSNGSSSGGGGGLVPTATRNNILTTMANLSEDKSGADRIRREMGVAEYIDEVFRLRQSTLVAPPPPPTQPSTSSDGGRQSGHSAEGNGN